METGQPPPSHLRRVDSTDGLQISDSQGGELANDTNPPEMGQQTVRQPGQSQICSHDQATRGSTDAGLTRTGQDANGRTLHKAPVVVASAEQIQGSSAALRERIDTPSPTRSHSHAFPPSPALAVQTLESPKAQDLESTKNVSSDTVSQPEASRFKRAFQMVIHLPGDGISQRVSCLDTCADLDVISNKVVESLGLQKDKYQGNALRPLGSIYLPESQVTFS